MPRRGLLNINVKKKQKTAKNEEVEEEEGDVEVVAQSEPQVATTDEKKEPEEAIPTGVEQNNKIILEKNIFSSSDVLPIIQKIDIAVLKKKKSLQRMEAERKASKLKKKMEKKDVPKKMRFMTAESIIYAHRIREIEKARLLNLKKKERPLPKTLPPEDPPLILAVRIKGLRGLPIEVRKILIYLRLPHTRSAAFLKNTPKTQQQLKYVEHFVTWGYPSLKTVRDIILKRGHTTNETGARIALNDNRVIEERLGQYNIVCLEDIVNEIWTCGKNFFTVLQFLASFHMNPPRDGYRKKASFAKGGDCGARGDAINKLIEKIN